MKRHVIVEALAALLILLFVYTASSKLMEYENFRNVLLQSPLIGKQAPLVAWALPLIELIIAVLLFIPRTRLTGLWCSFILMTVFTLYIAYMLAFVTKHPCPCGGVLSKLTWPQHLVFNIFFTLLSVVAIWLTKRPVKRQGSTEKVEVVLS